MSSTPNIRVAAINAKVTKEEPKTKVYVQILPLTQEERAWKHTKRCHFIRKSFDRVLGLN